MNKWIWPLGVLLLGATWTLGAGAQTPDAATMQKMMEQMQQQGAAGAMPNEAQMQMLMKNAASMQACMAEVDMQAMEAMRTESEAVMAEIKGLCASGDRSAAQSRAIAFGQRVSASPEMAKVRECSGEMAGMLPAMLAMTGDDVDANAASHVCDGM